MEQVHIQLQPSEMAVAKNATRIYCAYIMAGRVTEGQEAEWMQRSVQEAMRIAIGTDRAIQSDDETTRRKPLG